MYLFQGHFVFSACPITPGTLPTQACFDKYKLTFVQDILHNANYDPHYPERAYVAPYGITRRRDKTRRDLGGSETMDTLYPKSAKYSYKMRLPPNLHGDLVLIQWHYMTANSCVHEGYAEYNWPDGWLDALDLDAGVRNADKCGKAGLGAEQFRNCAEIRIVSLEEIAQQKAKDVEEARLKAEEKARLARIKAEEERERLRMEDETRLAIAKEEVRLQAKEEERARIKAAEEEARLNSNEERDKIRPDVKGTSSPNDNEPSGKSKPKQTKTNNKKESKNDLKKKKKQPKKNNDHESRKNHDGDKKKTENQDVKMGIKKKDNVVSKEKKKRLNDDDRHKMKSRMRIGIKGPRRKIRCS